MDLSKQALLHIMSHPNKISEKEIAELIETIEAYPYFQLGHSLLAKATHDQQSPDAYERLNKAAIYAPNRRVLRKLFYDDLHIAPPSSSLQEDVQEIKKEEDVQDTTLADENAYNIPEVYDPPLATEETPFRQDQEEEIIQSDEVYNELEENLRKLRESKNKFSEEEEEEESKKKIANETESENSENKQISAQESNPEAQHDPLLMHEIAPQEETLKPLDNSQRLQNELIDRFINSQDNISFKIKPPVDIEEESEDLSSQSTEVAENLVSENLAEIYLKQGKKGKAIEIYQKLIWKFPQKKAYFADKIESLKAE